MSKGEVEATEALVRALRRADAAEARAEKAEAASLKADCARVVAESEVARLQRMVYANANGSGALALERDLLHAEVLELRKQLDADDWPRERAENAEAARDAWRERALKAEAEAARRERLIDDLAAERASLLLLNTDDTASEWKERAEKAERDLDNWQYHARSADAEAVRVARIADEWQERAEKAEAEVDELKRQLDLLRPTNPPPQPGTGDVWQEIIDSLSTSHPMRAACIKRRELGIARYGHPLQYGNGRNGDQDLEEELLDAAAFAWQRGLRSFSGYLVNAASDPATWRTLRAEHGADLNAKAELLERWKVLLAEAHAALVDLLTHGDDAPAAAYQRAAKVAERAAKVAETIAGGAR